MASHEDVFDDEPLELPAQPSREETVTNIEEVDHMVAQLPIEAELDEGYVFGRNSRLMVDVYSAKAIKPPDQPTSDKYKTFNKL